MIQNPRDNMKATEAVRKLCEISSSLTDDKQKEAISVAITAIDCCARAYIID